MESGRQSRVRPFEDGARITLRPGGCLRVAGVPFIAAWICVWGMGVVFTVALLLNLMGVPLPIMRLTIPRNEFQSLLIVPIVFLLVFLVFWTRGGLMAIGFLLQLLFGHDAIVFGPSGWRVDRSFGFFSRTRDFEGWTVELQGRQQRLVARRGRKRQAVTPFGTTEELERVRDEIARRYPRTGELPEGFRERGTIDGSAVIASDAAPGAFNCGMFAIMAWNVPFILLVGVVTSSSAIIVGVVLSIATTAFATWCFFAERSWIVGPDRLEERLSAFGAAKKRRFPSGSQLVLETNENSDGNHEYKLRLVDPEQRRHTLYRSFHDPREIAALARFLQRRTGWTLSDPKKLTDEA